MRTHQVITFTMRPEAYDLFKLRCAEVGETQAAFIKTAIAERIARIERKAAKEIKSLRGVGANDDLSETET